MYGRMLADGRGGPCGTAAALDLFEKAAAEGHSGAMFALGALYAGGHDLPEDRMTAQRWFRAAAELGHGQAQLMLGRYLPKASPASQTRRRRARGSSKPPPRASKKPRQISPHCAETPQ